MKLMMELYISHTPPVDIIRDAKNILTAQTRVYRKMTNPSWEIDRKLLNKLYKLSLALPAYNRLFSEFDGDKPAGTIITDSHGLLLRANMDYVVLYFGKVIEVRYDGNRIIENEILRSAPDEIYKEICHYI
jgi:hypothetical protein